MAAVLKLGVDIQVSKSGNGFEVTAAGLNRLTQQSQTASTVMGTLKGAVLGVTTAFLGLQGLNVLRGLIEQGIAFNAQMESSRLGIAAIIGQFGQVQTAGGTALKGLEINLVAATDMQKKLQVAALKTTATYGDMVVALQSGLGPALKAGFDTDQVVKFTTMVTQAAGAIGLPMHQLSQEIRALFAGDIGPDSRLANMLFTDIPRNKIKGYVAELQKSGKFYAEMEKRLSSFVEAGEMAGDTFAGAWSNAQDAIGQLLGEGTFNGFKRMKDMFKDLSASLVTFDKQGNATFNPKLVGMIDTLTQSLIDLSVIMGGLLRIIAPVASGITMVFNAAMSGALLLVQGIARVLFTQIGMWVGDIARKIQELMAQNPVLGKIFGGMNGTLNSLQRFGDWARNVDTSISNKSQEYAQRATDQYYGTTFEVDPHSKPKVKVKPKPDKTTNDDSAARLAAQATLLSMQAQSRELDLQLQLAREFDPVKRKLLEYDHATLRVMYEWADKEREILAATKLTTDEKQRQLILLDSNTTKRLDAMRADQLRDSLLGAEKAINDLLDKRDAVAKELRDLAALNAKTLQDVMAKARAPVEAFFSYVGSGLKNAFTSILKGDIRGAFEGFFDSIFAGVADRFATRIDEAMQYLANLAAGQEQKKNDKGELQWNPDGSREMVSTSKAKWAKGGMMGLEIASAAYGLFTNPAPKRGQNMMSGAMSGAMIGATMGAKTFNPYAMIVGAVVGAIVGAFAPTEKGKNIKIVGTNGKFIITGMDGGAAGWGYKKLQQEINSAVARTARQLDEIFLGLPTAALAALGDWRPDLSKIDVGGKGDGKNWNEEIDNYLKESLPRGVFDAYRGSITKMLKFAGVSDARIVQLADLLKNAKTDEAIQMIKDYVDVLYGLKDIADKLGGDLGGRRRAVGGGGKAGDNFRANVFARADAGPMAAFSDIATSIGVLSRGFDQLTHEEQVSRGKQILSLSQQFFDGMEEYLLKLRASQQALNDSIDSQIRDIKFDQITDPKQRVEFILDEQRQLREKLKGAKSQEEIDFIVSKIQGNAGVLYELLGKTPEAAAQVTAMLEDARKLANEGYAKLFAEAERVTTTAGTTVLGILASLQAGLQKLGLVPGDGDGTGTGGGAGDGSGENDGDERNIDPFMTSVSMSATALAEDFAPSVASATLALTDFAKATVAAAQQAVVVNVGDTIVQVQVTGTAERLIEVVAAQVTQRAIATVERRNLRASIG